MSNTSEVSESKSTPTNHGYFSIASQYGNGQKEYSEGLENTTTADAAAAAGTSTVLSSPSFHSANDVFAVDLSQRCDPDGRVVHEEPFMQASSATARRSRSPVPSMNPPLRPPLKRVTSRPFVAFISQKQSPFYPIRVLQHRIREYLGEFLATFVLIVIGLGANAQFTLVTHGQDTTFPLYFTWGFAIICAVYVGRRISSAHLNPAVTIGLAVFRGFSWRKVPGYLFAQTLASFAAAALIYWCYLDPLNTFDGGVRQTSGPLNTAKIFYVQQSAGITLGHCFLNEVVATALLLMVICACTDRRNNSEAGIVLPFAFGFTVAALLIAFAFTGGLAINPARDFGPRLFAWIPYGRVVWTGNNHYFWVPLVAPIAGALIGCLAYDLFVPTIPLGTEHYYADEVKEYAVNRGIDTPGHLRVRRRSRADSIGGPILPVTQPMQTREQQY